MVSFPLWWFYVTFWHPTWLQSTWFFSVLRELFDLYVKILFDLYVKHSTWLHSTQNNLRQIMTLYVVTFYVEQSTWINLRRTLYVEQCAFYVVLLFLISTYFWFPLYSTSNSDSLRQMHVLYVVTLYVESISKKPLLMKCPPSNDFSLYQRFCRC